MCQKLSLQQGLHRTKTILFTAQVQTLAHYVKEGDVLMEVGGQFYEREEKFAYPYDFAVRRENLSWSTFFYVLSIIANFDIHFVLQIFP
jgi:hypothetical protein